MKKRIYSSLAVVAAGGAAYALLGWDLGPATTPLAKFFLIFFGALIVLQIIPAVVLFTCMVKELVFRAESNDEQSLVVESQGEKRVQ